MRIRDVLKARGRGVSFEFFPPKEPGGDIFLMNVIKELAGYDPLYVSVTYGAGGSTRERTRHTLMSIKKETDLNVMSHLTCIGATGKSMETILEDYRAGGVDNILALRGDPPKDMRDFDFSKGQFRYAKDLVEFIRRFDRDFFSIAVAAYPEKHPEAPSMEKDIEHLKMKADAGADFAITQMFFDNHYYYDFMDKVLKHGIVIPVFPGIMPITDFNKIKQFCSFCNASIPESLEKKMLPMLDDPGGIRKAGTEYIAGQCEDLIRNGFEYLHFYTLNRADAVSEILGPLKEYFKQEIS